MIDLIGVLVATCLFFALASIVAVILAIVTWLIIPKSARGKKRLLLAAALLPICTAVYLWACVAVLPGQSLFGDIDEPLPNGFHVRALGKMPDFATIDNPNNAFAKTGLSQDIGEIAVVGPYVVGRYSHPWSTFQAQVDEPYFLFDTRKGTTAEFPTEQQLFAALGSRPELMQIQSFRSPLAATRRRTVGFIEFAPPLVFLALLLSASINLRINARSSDIYT